MNEHIGRVYHCAQCGKAFRVLRHVGDELYECRGERGLLAGAYIFPDRQFCSGFCVREHNLAHPEVAYSK